MPTNKEVMQQALDALEYTADYDSSIILQKAAIEALRAQLAQPEPEPVAWLYKKKDGVQVITDDPDYADGTWTPLYTAPPQREFIGLTDDEIDKICETQVWDARRSYARAIEATLKEKNAI